MKKKFKIKDYVNLELLKIFGYHIIDDVTLIISAPEDKIKKTTTYLKFYYDNNNKILTTIKIDDYDRIIYCDNVEYIKDLIDADIVEKLEK